MKTPEVINLNPIEKMCCGRVCGSNVELYFLAFFCWKDNWNIFVLLRSSLYLTKCAAQVVIFGQFCYDQCCHQINLNLSSNFCIASKSFDPGFPLLEVSYPWHFPILISETRSATSILPWNLLSQVSQMGFKEIYI